MSADAAPDELHLVFCGTKGCAHQATLKEGEAAWGTLPRAWTCPIHGRAITVEHVKYRKAEVTVEQGV